MDVDLIFKVAAIGIIVSVLNILLSRSGREEQGGPASAGIMAKFSGELEQGAVV